MSVNHDLPSDVLGRAVRAVGLDICGSHDGWNSATDLERRTAEVHVEVVLPILIPAIETALLERMIADAKGNRWWLGRSVGWTDESDGQVEDWLGTYLPATEGDTE